jgi:hypothetical protein
MAAMEASTPEASTAIGPVSSMRQTPPTPIPAPATCIVRGCSESAAQASSIIATGEVAMIVEAMLVGSICAAR